MALDVFKIQGSVEIDGDKAKRELNEVNSHAKTVASKLGSTFQGIGQAFQKIGRGITIGTTVAISGLASLTKSAITAYAEYEQLVGGVETLFKESGDKVLAYAKEAYKNQGMSANQYMETVTSFSASLLQSLGGDTAKATEYANRAVTDMSDNANKMGTDISMIQNAYQGFAKQNYTMLDNLKLGKLHHCSA